MILGAVVALALTQCGPAYNRTKAIDGDPKSHLLYWREKTEIVWQANDQGNPETTGDTEFAAIEQSFATWQVELARCGSLTFSEGPRTANRKAGEVDKQNVVLWRFAECGTIVAPSDPCFKDENGCGNPYDCWDHSPMALAITTTSFDPMTGRILDADIELNTPGFLFTTVSAPPCVKPAYLQSCVASDVQNTVTHEIGHMLGLAHNCSPGSTMYASASPGETSKRILDDGSKQFICDAYPKGSPSTSGPLTAVTGELGKPKTGCVAGPGALWGGLALLGLRRKRTR